MRQGGKAALESGAGMLAAAVAVLDEAGGRVLTQHGLG